MVRLDHFSPHGADIVRSMEIVSRFSDEGIQGWEIGYAGMIAPFPQEDIIHAYDTPSCVEPF